MKRSMLAGRAPHRGRRGAQLLEFAIVLPLFLFILLFSLDMSRILFTSGLVHDAAFTSARAGAQIGAAGSSAAGASKSAFTEVIADYGWNVGEAQFEVLSGNVCSKDGTLPHDNFVTVRVSYGIRPITPGLGTLLGTIGGPTGAGGQWKLQATGLAKCEIARK